jgi:carbamoyl-phosphate synthase large subunit
MGYALMGTGGTAAALQEHGIDVTRVRKVHEGRPNLLDYLANGEIALIVNTPFGVGSRVDGWDIRTAAVGSNTLCVTTVPGLAAAVQGIESLLRGDIGVRSLQEYAAALNASRA